MWWPYEETRQTQGFYAGEQVRLERGGEHPEVLLIDDTLFLEILQQVAPEVAGRFHDPAQRARRVKLTVLAALGILGITAILYLWGIPALAALLAPRVPQAWEERLGEAVLEHLAPADLRCTEPKMIQAVDRMVGRLTAPFQNVTYKVRVLVADLSVVNAVAVPGGTVVLFRGLVERTKSPEELAGVLAHELQHVFQRHGTRALIQHVSTGLLLAALTGDATGIATYGLESARLLGALRYSRQNEAEADAGGMRMLLEAGVDPAGMIGFFDTIRKESIRVPAGVKYLLSHPTTEERIETLKRLASASPRSSTKLLSGHDWDEIKKLCRPKITEG
jgi:predicted Zn-dependent protease